MPNSPSFTYPRQILDTNEEELVEDIIVETDDRTEEILHTFAQRRDHVRNICQTNQIGSNKHWKSFKQSLKEDNFIRNGKSNGKLSLSEPR